MRRLIFALSATTASALLFLVAAPHAFGILAMPPGATVALDAGIDAVLATHSPTRQQTRAMHRIENLLHPHRRATAAPHRNINDAKKIVKAIGSRFDAEIADPSFDADVCNEIGAWVDAVGGALEDLAVDAGRVDERRIARAFAKAERLFGQAIDARDHANGPKTLAKLAQCMKQLQKVAKFLNVDISTL